MSDSTASNVHHLKMKLTDEGYVVGEVLCPHQGVIPQTADCSVYPFDGTTCAVREEFKAVGMECFKGEVELPTIPIQWVNDYDEPELYIFPMSGRKEATAFDAGCPSERTDRGL